MKSIFTIAANTFREAIRNRILYLILFFALLMIGSSGVVGELSVGSQEKIITDLGFAAISLFSVAIIVFLGVTVVYNELERKTIYTVVSKPIDRRQFLLGKYFGLMATVFVNVALMTVFYLFVLHYLSAGDDEEISWFAHAGRSVLRTFVSLVAWNAYPATLYVVPVVLLVCLELAIVMGFAIFFSSFSTPFLSMMMTVAAFVVGRSNEDIVIFSEKLARDAERMGTDKPPMYYLAVATAWAVPNLGAFQRSVVQVVHHKTLDVWWETLVYAPLYTAGLLALSTLIFDRRNFK